MNEPISIEKTTDPRLINSFSFSVPAKKYTIDFDVTTTNALPAFLEIAIYLLDTLETISPSELQSFLGLSDREREELLRQIASTDLAFINNIGLIEATHKLRALKQSDGTIQLENIERHTASFVVDLFSEHIQPRAISSNVSNSRDLVSEEVLHKNIDAEKTFKNDFSRFKYCSKVENLKKTKTRLYRINECYYDKLTSLPVNVGMYSQWQSDGHLKVYSELSGFNGEDLDIATNSGLLGHINNFLNRQTAQHESITFRDFCHSVNDEVLIKYESPEGTFDVENYLRDRDSRKTGYGSPKTSGIIGPIFLPNNQGNFINWMSKTPKIQPVFWLPASASYWGASSFLKTFYERSAEFLPKKLSSMALTLPSAIPEQEKYEYKQRYNGAADILLSFRNANPLTEVEILVVPGTPCWGMVQYHARISPAYGFKDVRIPIGYTTYDPDRVQILWELLLNRLCFKNDKDVSVLGKGESPPIFLDCLHHVHDWSRNIDDPETQKNIEDV